MRRSIRTSGMNGAHPRPQRGAARATPKLKSCPRGHPAQAARRQRGLGRGPASKQIDTAPRTIPPHEEPGNAREKRVNARRGKIESQGVTLTRKQGGNEVEHAAKKIASKDKAPGFEPHPRAPGHVYPHGHLMNKTAARSRTERKIPRRPGVLPSQPQPRVGRAVPCRVWVSSFGARQRPRECSSQPRLRRR
jgi:hypothetical protein